MSILLDALKKSEEQRQLGNTPDIHGSADHKPEGAKTETSQWLPPALLTVAAVAIMWLVWAQYRAPEAEAVQEVATVSRSPQLSLRSPAGVVPDSGSDAPARAARSPVETYAEKDAEPDSAGSAEPGESDRREEVARTFNQFQKPAPAESGKSKQQAAATGPKQPAADVSETGPDDARDQTAVPTFPAPHVSDPVSYWELPQSVRDGMPEFSITVMVYAEDPGERFMLINGQRLVEKESLDGMELEEIRRDGAVFRYRNYRFLVEG